MNMKLIIGLLLLLSFEAQGQKTAPHVKKSHGRIIQVHQTCTEYFEDGWWDFVKCDDVSALPAWTGTHIEPTSAAEPVDIPAVQVHEEAEYLLHSEWPYTPTCPAGFKYGSYHSDKDWPSCERFTYTCADKSRVLLASEDGNYWCHKVASQVVKLTNSQ